MYRAGEGKLRINPKGVSILVTKVEGEEDAHAHMLEGQVTFRGSRLDFKAIAFGRIGGFNVRVEFTEASRRKLKEMRLESSHIEELEVYVQRMIVEGRFDSSPEAAAHEHRFES